MDNLEHHRAFAKTEASDQDAAGVPARQGADGEFSPPSFNQWVEQLAAAANMDINSFSAFISALEKRHEFFHAQGCRLSDHGMNHCFADFCSEKTAAGHF